jgi:hypothetical protein
MQHLDFKKFGELMRELKSLEHVDNVTESFFRVKKEYAAPLPSTTMAATHPL